MAKPDECSLCKSKNGARRMLPYGWSLAHYCDECWKKQDTYIKELRRQDALDAAGAEA